VEVGQEWPTYNKINKLVFQRAAFNRQATSHPSPLSTVRVTLVFALLCFGRGFHQQNHRVSFAESTMGCQDQMIENEQEV
jgi:hypothetical protein